MSVEPEFLPLAWPTPVTVRAAFTTRRGGVSRGAWQSLNLATHVGDDAAAVAANRLAVRRALQLPGEPRWLDQVHGARVLRLDAEDFDLRADAAISARAADVAVVMVADCLPILMCDSSGREIAAVHAGWRGLASNIIARAVASFAARPTELLVWIGPAIGASAYCVGDDVRAQLLAADLSNECAFKPTRERRWHADLGLLAARQLARAGVVAITRANACVHEDPQRFFSYRRDGRCGRMGALIWRNA
jgi:YfiH family protein